MHSAQLKITDLFAPVHQDIGQTLTHISDARDIVLRDSQAKGMNFVRKLVSVSLKLGFQR
jgi:hypothetical protein